MPGDDVTVAVPVTSQVDQRLEGEILAALLTFEKARDWADLTGCLNKLHRILLRLPTPAPAIPASDVLAKRLGQCLNPTLPGQLAYDLGLWSPGLFPLFQDAASHVKPSFLDIIDTYYLPLNVELLPCLTGLDQAPCSARLGQTLTHIAKVCVGMEPFMAALWTVMLRTPVVRLQALQLFCTLTPLNIFELPEDQIHTFLPQRSSLVLRVLERLFEDPSILVKRQLLDLLIAQIPLSSTVFSYDEKIRLLGGSIHVVGATEWSLTRRLLQWLTGQADLLSVIDLAYFRAHVRDELCAVLMEKLSIVPAELDVHLRPPNGAKDWILPLKVLRVILSEAEELGPLLIEKLGVPLLNYALLPAVLDILRPILCSSETVTKAVWGALETDIQEAIQGGIVSPCHSIELSVFFLDHACTSTVGSVEQQLKIAAQALRAVSLVDIPTDMHARLELAIKCLDRSQQTRAECTQLTSGVDDRVLHASRELFLQMETFVPEATKLMGKLTSEDANVVVDVLAELLLHLLRLNGQSPAPDLIWLSKMAAVAAQPVGFVYCMHNFLQDTEWYCARIFITVLRGVPELAVKYIQNDSSALQALALRLWDNLVSDNEASQLLLQIHYLDSETTGTEGSLVKALLVGGLSHHSYEVRVSGFQNFALLWQLSHNQFPDTQIFPGVIRLVLDCLEAPEPTLRHVCRSWLTAALSQYLPHIVDPLFNDLLTPDSRRSLGSNRVYLQLYDTALSAFVLSRLGSIARAEPQSFINACQSHQLSTSLVALSWSHRAYSEDSVASSATFVENIAHDDPEVKTLGYGDDRCAVDYVDMCCVSVVRFVQTETSTDFGEEFRRLNSMVQSAAVEFLRIFLETAVAYLPSRRCVEIHEMLTSPLLDLVTKSETTTLQIQLLDILKLTLPTVLTSSVISETTITDPEVMFGESNVEEDPKQIMAKAKSIQINLCHKTITLSGHVLPALLRLLDSAAACAQTLETLAPFAITLSSLANFPLFVLPLVPANCKDLPAVCQALLLHFCRLLQQSSCLVTSIHLLRGLRDLLGFMLLSCSPCAASPVPIAPPSTWSAMFWGSQQDLKRPDSKSPLARIVQAHCPRVLMSLSDRMAKWSACNNGHSRAHSISERFGSARNFSFSRNDASVSVSQQGSDILLPHAMCVSSPLAKTSGRSDIAHLVEVLHKEVQLIISNLMSKLPQIVLLSLVSLNSYAKTIVETIVECKEISLSSILQYMRPILSSSLQSVPMTITDSGKLPPDFVGRETDVLALVHDFLEAHSSRLHAHTSHVRPYGLLILYLQTEWHELAALMNCVTTNSDQPASVLWLHACLQSLDGALPSRESTFTPNTKQVRKDLQVRCNFYNRKPVARLRSLVEQLQLEISHSVALIAAQQFHLNHSRIFDLKPPLPPATRILERLLPDSGESSTRMNEITFDSDAVFIRRPASDSLSSSLEQDPVAKAAQLALASVICLARQVATTQKRTLVGGTLLMHFATESQHTVLQAVMRSASLDTIQYRYLGLLAVQTLPVELVPAANLPAKKLFLGFVQSPAFNYVTTLFGQVSPSQSNDVILFRGLDRRCLRALSHAVALACQTEDLNQLAETLITSRPHGVFSTRESEIWRKARELKRLSFVLLSCPKDFFSTHISAITARLFESLKSEASMLPAHTALHVQAFLCLRVLLLRMSSVGPIWPVLLTEISRICSSKYSADFPLLLAVLKLIDLAVILDIPDFHMHQWIFIVDTPALAAAAQSGSSSQPVHPSATAVFQPICGRLAESRTGQAVPVTREPTSQLDWKKRQPLVRERRIETLEELQQVASKLNGQNRTPTIMGQLDDEVLRSIEDDLVECSDSLLDWAPQAFWCK